MWRRVVVACAAAFAVALTAGTTATAAPNRVFPKAISASTTFSSVTAVLQPQNGRVRADVRFNSAPTESFYVECYSTIGGFQGFPTIADGVFGNAAGTYSSHYFLIQSASSQSVTVTCRPRGAQSGIVGAYRTSSAVTAGAMLPAPTVEVGYQRFRITVPNQGTTYPKLYVGCGMQTTEYTFDPGYYGAGSTTTGWMSTRDGCTDSFGYAWGNAGQTAFLWARYFTVSYAPTPTATATVTASPTATPTVTATATVTSTPNYTAVALPDSQFDPIKLAVILVVLSSTALAVGAVYRGS